MRLKLMMLFISIILASGTLICAQEVAEEPVPVEMETVIRTEAEVGVEVEAEAEVGVGAEAGVGVEAEVGVGVQAEVEAEVEAGVEAEAEVEVEASPGNVTLDFKDADIRNILRILSYKSGVNIIAGKGVEGPVSIRLTDVPWDKALDVILKTYDYGYERIDGNIIAVSPLEALTQKKMAEKELAEVEPLITEVFSLEYIDASDAKKVVEGQLSSRGKVTIFQKTVQRGWPFGAGGGTGAAGGVGGFGVQERKEQEPRAKILVVSDIASYIGRVRRIIKKIDVKPKQVLIETRIVEVNRDRLKDLGFDWGTGSTGAESGTIFTQSVGMTRIGGQVLGGEVTPSVFDPKASGINSTFPYDAGLSLVFRKLTGTQFEVILHALEEEVESNTLSAPRIMTLDSQEAKILVGESRPIISSTVSSSEGTVSVNQTLEYYQNLGIVLNVIPQISADNYINMVLHPAVYSFTDQITLTSTISGVDPVYSYYPIVLMREADTQVLMKSGETIVIGGLLKDIKKEGTFSVPILGDIPILGMLFQRKTTDIEKIDLLIFLTARIVEAEEVIETDYVFPMVVEKNPSQAKIEEGLEAEKPEKVGIVETPRKE